MTALVDRLEQLHAEATDAPWHVTDCRHQKGGQVRLYAPRSQVANVLAAGNEPESDAALIVELRNALPALLTALRAAHDVRETWRRKGLSASGCYAQAEALAEALAPLFGEDTTP